jgi:hypothetical protein
MLGTHSKVSVRHQTLLKKDINAGLALWQGYFQSLRTSQNKLSVDVDISTGVMYKALNLSLEFFRKNNPGDLGNIPHGESAFSGVHVKIKYAGRKQAPVITSTCTYQLV